MEKWISINRVIQFGTSLIAVMLLAAIGTMPAASFPSLVAQSNIYWQKAEAKRLYEQGINQSGGGDVKEALQSWQLALAIYQQIQDRAGEEKVLEHLGTTSMKLQTPEQLTEVIEYFQQELVIAQQIKDRSFEERVRYWLEAVDRKIQDRQKAEAERLYEQGINQNGRGHIKEALQSWQLALAIYQKIQDHAGEEKALEHLGNTLDNLGTTSMKLQTLEQLTEAIDYFQQELAIAREIKDRSFEERARYWLEAVDRIRKSAIYKLEREAYQGDEQYRTGQFEAALQSWQQDLIRYRKSGNPYKEASTLVKLSDAYRSLGNYAKAIEYGQQSLAIVQKPSNNSLTQLLINGNVPNSLELIKDEVLTNLGDDYFALGNYAKAIDYYQQSLVIVRELSDPLGTWSLLNKVGHVYYTLGEYAKAIDYQQRSLAAWQTIYGSVREQGKGRALGDLGSVYYAMGDYAKAIDYQQQSLTIARTVKDRQGEGQSLGNLGLVYFSRRDYVKAINYLQQSLAIMQEIKDRPGEGVSLSNLGNVFAAQKQSELAIIFYKQSVNVREGIRQDIRILSRELQESYTQTVAGSYRRLADLLLSQGRVLEAQQVLELLKIQELRDYTRDTRAGGETQGSPLTPVESRVVPPFNNVVNLGLKLTQCEQKPPYCPEREQLRALRDQANAEFNKQADKLRALAKQQRQRDPAQIQQEELTVAAQKIVQSQPKTVLIYPLVLEDKLWLVWGTQAGKQGVVFNSKLVPVGRKELATTVVEFRQLLEQPGDVKELQKVSQKLYQWLIAPLRAELDTNNIRNLVFSLDRSTRYIPMAALFDGKKYLIESFNTSTILTAGLTDTSDRLSPKIDNDPVLALGLSEQVGDFKSLPNVQDEINGIIRSQTNPNGIYPGLPLINKDFTKDAFKYLIDYRILHIATHAQFISQNPEDSFLLLGDGNQFKIPEVKNLTDLGGIHLVVLSACETARGGEDKEGIEVSGLSYYFLTSGAKSVIASLWLVNDASTSQLMRYLYQNLATGKITKTEALRQAQLTMIAGKNQNSDTKDRSSVRLTPGKSGQTATISRNLSHPYYWAPFILIGNGL